LPVADGIFYKAPQVCSDSILLLLRTLVQFPFTELFSHGLLSKSPCTYPTAGI